MHVDLITTDGVCVMSMETDCVFPVAGDVFSTPDGRVFVVVQRTIIAAEQPVPMGKLVDLKAPKAVDIRMQCLLRPVETMEVDHAIKS